MEKQKQIHTIGVRLLVFTVTSNDKGYSGLNIIQLNYFTSSGGVLGHAFLPPSGGDAHFDEDENWVFHSRDGAELETIVTHELGHTLGLSHSTVRGSVMVPFYLHYRDDFGLHIDDIAGLQYLYGISDCFMYGRLQNKLNSLLVTNYF